MKAGDIMRIKSLSLVRRQQIGYPCYSVSNMGLILPKCRRSVTVNVFLVSEGRFSGQAEGWTTKWARYVKHETRVFSAKQVSTSLDHHGNFYCRSKRSEPGFAQFQLQTGKKKRCLSLIVSYKNSILCVRFSDEVRRSVSARVTGFFWLCC